MRTRFYKKFLLAILILYLLGAFVAWTFNPIEWSVVGRIFFVIGVLFSLIISSES